MYHDTTLRACCCLSASLAAPAFRSNMCFIFIGYGVIIREKHLMEMRILTKVYYVRHAEPNYANHDDVLRELTPKGLMDRKLVTEFLMDKRIDVIVSSPYKRAIDTVKDFADRVGAGIEIIDDFRERKIDSIWIDDFIAFSKAQWRDFHYKLSDGECLSEVQTRNIRALNELLNRYQGRNIVIGGHGTALSTIINYYDPAFGYDDFEAMKRKMPWIVEFHFDDMGKCCEIIKHDLY